MSQSPFRYDFVGSFLRPQRLLGARAAFAAGQIDAEALKAVEDECITELIAKQKAAGYHAITDGEFRRATWHLDFMWGFEGIGHQETKTGIPFHGEAAMIDDTYLTGRLAVGEHPFVEHFRFVKQFEEEGVVARQTIPSPAQFLFQMLIPGNWEKVLEHYDNEEELIQDIGSVYRTVIGQLYAAGCRNLQFDDCTWGVCVDPNGPAILGVDEAGLQDIIAKLIRVNNLAIEGKPEDLVITTHICRGNYNSTWACEGGYEKVAEKLFAEENVSAFYLEFDDERSGGFEPLRFLAPDKKVVLGLVTSKHGDLEDKEVIKRRIAEAAKYVPLERLALSPQCGFASCDCGNHLTDEDQWKKLALIKEVAEEVWGA